MHSLFFWTGVVVWGVVALALVALVGVAIHAAALIVSYIRWAWLDYRNRGGKLSRWTLFVDATKIFRRNYWEFLLEGAGEYSTSEGAYWKGIGNWRLSESKPTE